MAYNNKKGGNRSNNSQKSDYVKKTGCTYGVDKNNQPYVRGWRATKMGIITYYACHYSGTNVHESKGGRQWANVMVKIKVPNFPETITSGLWDVASNKVIVNKEGIVMNPKGGKGGYCGKFGGN